MSTSARAAPIRVLFVCTGNSARSIMAEALLRARGGDRFEVSSAGTDPRGVNPLTVKTLRAAGLPTHGLSSKSVTDFLGQPFDYVITVCDKAREACPYFPGAVRRAHWDNEDPAEAQGSEEERLAAFRAVFDRLAASVDAFAGEVAGL